MTAVADHRARLLREAADVIRTRGLHKGQFMPAGGDPKSCPVCMVGAINFVLCGDPNQMFGPGRYPLLDAVWDVIDGRPVARWNDDAARTADEVIDAFTRAAELVEGQS